MTICVILLAGGTGSRMRMSTPKQYLHLKNKPVIHYSFDVFRKMPEVAEIVVVCNEEYRHFFEQHSSSPKITFALPGTRRQDSVENGFKAKTSNSPIICIHDGVRPFITETIIRKAIDAAKEYGAATVGMPVKFTVKECDTAQIVTNTPDRNRVWEIQTPQVIKASLLGRAFDNVNSKGLTVTDDVSMVELLGLPVKLVEGCYTNLKITTPDDLSLSEYLLKDQ